MDFKKEVQRLADAWENIEKYKIDVTKSVMPSLDFHQSRHNLYLQSFRTTAKNIQRLAYTLDVPEDDEDLLTRIKEITNKLDATEAGTLKQCVEKLAKLAKELPDMGAPMIDLPVGVPADIFSEIEADSQEMARCFQAGCYRSAVMLCGRILETILHRKYFEVTGTDLLETSPGTGLGNIIAKLKEKNIALDPAITQQIHLINQIRIFSVHKKQAPFHPTRGQTQAIILYTGDVLNKLFQERT